MENELNYQFRDRKFDLSCFLDGDVTSVRNIIRPKYLEDVQVEFMHLLTHFRHLFQATEPVKANFHVKSSLVEESKLCFKLLRSYDQYGGLGVSKKFKVKVFYVMGKALSGELSCPFDRSCFSTINGLLLRNSVYSIKD